MEARCIPISRRGVDISLVQLIGIDYRLLVQDQRNSYVDETSC